MRRKGKDFLIREGSLDDYVIRENYGSQYDRLELNITDVVLDIGANIGAFLVYRHEEAGWIHSYEPEPENFELLNRHRKMNHALNSTTYQLAVTGTEMGHITLYLNGGKNLGNHSLLNKRGRETVQVPSETLDQIISETRATKAKIDVEGGEYDMLMSSELVSSLDAIIVEYHFAMLNDKDMSLYVEFVNKLRNDFNTVDARSPESLNKPWTTVVFARQ